MKLRTFTGLDKETTCACGCNQKILARPDIQVVVDMDAMPRKRYLPGHAGNGYGSTSYARREPKPKEEAKPAPAPAPASPAPAGPAPAGPSPTSPQPQIDPAPVPTPKVVTTNVPSLADNRPWKILSVTISIGDYSSVKVGVADFGRENETLAQLGTRLVAELTNDIRTELDVVHQVQQGKPLSAPAREAGALSGPADPLPVPTQGAVTAPTTYSPAATAGASPQPSVVTLSGRSTLEPAPRGVVGPEMMETRRQVSMELESDVSAVRTVKKRKAGNQWLKAHGYESFDQVLPTDFESLKGLLVQFEVINYGTDAPRPPLSEPVFQTASSVAGASR